MSYIITDDERLTRKYRIWEHLGVSRPVDPFPDQAVRFEAVLQLGLQVKCHRRSDAVVVQAIVRYILKDALILQFSGTSLLGLTSTATLVSCEREAILTVLRIFEYDVSVLLCTVLYDKSNRITATL